MVAPRRPTPPPLETRDYPPVIVATSLWAIAAIVLWIKHAEMARHGAGWWLWVAVSGFALGLWGMVLTALHHRSGDRRRERSDSTNPPQR